MAGELQPDKEKREANAEELLGLLVPCANQVGNEQKGKDRFVLNTKRLSAKDIGYYYFLGILMGICIRTGVCLPVDLPRSVWKKLVGQNINMLDILEAESRFVW